MRVLPDFALCHSANLGWTIGRTAYLHASNLKDFAVRRSDIDPADVIILGPNCREQWPFRPQRDGDYVVALAAQDASIVSIVSRIGVFNDSIVAANRANQPYAARAPMLTAFLQVSHPAASHFASRPTRADASDAPAKIAAHLDVDVAPDRPLSDALLDSSR